MRLQKDKINKQSVFHFSNHTLDVSNTKVSGYALFLKLSIVSHLPHRDQIAISSDAEDRPIELNRQPRVICTKCQGEMLSRHPFRQIGHRRDLGITQRNTPTADCRSHIRTDGLAWTEKRLSDTSGAYQVSLTIIFILSNFIFFCVNFSE
jgi:hypothetical protein